TEVTPAQRTALLARLGLQPGRSAGRRHARLHLQANATLTDVLAALRAAPEVAQAEENLLTVPLATDPARAEQWGIAAMHFADAWPLTRGEVTVAVLDSGLDCTLSEFAGQCLPGYDFVNDDDNPADDHGHGTMVAGVIAALADNGVAIAGAAPGCRLLPVKVIAADGYGTYADIADAIVWSADRGARVINLSVGGYSPSVMLQEAVDYAVARGCVIVAAAGNDHAGDPLYPAACDGVIGVAALDQSLQPASFSNYGPAIDCAAPGVAVPVTLIGGGWQRAAGTSFAAPLVSAAAALAATRFPDDTSESVTARLLASATDLGAAGRDDATGCGLPDALAVLQTPAPAVPELQTVPLAGGAVADVRLMTDAEFAALRSSVGTAEPGRNYNVVVDGHGTGLRPPTAAEWEASRGRTLLATAIRPAGVTTQVLPDSHNNAATKWFPPIGDQGNEGACVTFAIGYYCKTFQEAKEHDWDLSACRWQGGAPTGAYQHYIMSPDFLYHLINGGTDGGSWYGNAVEVIDAVGCASWQTMPYDDATSTAWPEELAWREAPLYRGSGAGMVTLSVATESGITALKTLVAGGNCAAVRVDANNYAVLADTDLWKVGVYDTAAGPNHGNTVVGYDDNFGPYTEEGESRRGAFVIANQWDTGFTGDVSPADGFYHISYAAMQRCFGTVYYFTDTVAYNPRLLLTANLTHGSREELTLTAAADDTAASSATHEVALALAGSVALSGAFITCDATALLPALGDQDTLFLRVADAAGGTTGSVSAVRAERYTTYDRYGGAESIVAADPAARATTSGGTLDVALWLGAAEVTDTTGPNRWFVATTGDTGNSGLSVLQAKRYLGQVCRGSATTTGRSLLTPGDSVYVMAGTYSETVALDTDGVVLLGEGMTATIIDGGESSAAARTAVTVSAAGAGLRNLTVTGAGRGIVATNAPRLQLERVTARGAGGAGVTLAG
ncbi:MAG TPA: S8 family serine peptidase, partial [bacterium]|nr:S8 family serine peptidase [bacterium]